MICRRNSDSLRANCCLWRRVGAFCLNRSGKRRLVIEACTCVAMCWLEPGSAWHDMLTWPTERCAGLRVASRAPFALLQQIGSSRATQGLTYLRLGCCNMPQLAPLSALTCLARLHLHMLRGQVGPLAPLTQLTYLHLHGSVEDLPQSLGTFRKLQKLSLIKCRRLRPDEVRAIGTLSELTSLELPHSKPVHALRDVRPLSRLHVRLSPTFSHPNALQPCMRIPVSPRFCVLASQRTA